MEDWIKSTKAFRNSKTHKGGANQAAKCMKGQHANEMAFAEAGSENVTPDMGDEKVETPDVVNGASNVTATFFAPTIFHKVANPVLVQSPVHLHKVIFCLLCGTRGGGWGSHDIVALLVSSNISIAISSAACCLNKVEWQNNHFVNIILKCLELICLDVLCRPCVSSCIPPTPHNCKLILRGVRVEACLCSARLLVLLLLWLLLLWLLLLLLYKHLPHLHLQGYRVALHLAAVDHAQPGGRVKK